MTWFYRYETKGIQSWILSSGRLRDLAGGSALIEALVEEARRGIEDAGGVVHYGAAGGALASFPDRTALERFAAEWPMVVAFRAPGLQVVQAWVNAEDGGGAPLRALAERLAARRNRPAAPPIEAGPWMERAGRSGLPAVPAPPDLAGKVPWKTHWDRPTVVKERSRREMKAAERSFHGLLQRSELNDETDTWGDAPVAVIHADGSGVGARIAGLAGNLKRMKAFSTALGRATREATGAAFEQLRQTKKDDELRVRPVVMGGDDLTVIVPGSDALRFVRAWLDAFSEQTRAAGKALGGEVFAGVGVAIVNRGYPFHMAHEAAERACRGAKRDVVENGRPAASAVRFLRITTALESGLEPVTWRREQLEPLAALIDAARALPRGTLRGWLTLVDSGDEPARNAAWRRAREVAQDAGPDRWERFASALSALGADPQTGMLTADSTATPLRVVLTLSRLTRSGASRSKEA